VKTLYLLSNSKSKLLTKHSYRIHSACEKCKSATVSSQRRRRRRRNGINMREREKGIVKRTGREHGR
jgi:hypothetical protein